MKPTRADRCVYVLYSDKSKTDDKTTSVASQSLRSRPQKREPEGEPENYQQVLEQFMEKMLDPELGSQACGRTVLGLLVLHVDDLFFAGSPAFYDKVIKRIKADYLVGSEDTNDVTFTGQRVRWEKNAIVVDQDKAVEELSEIKLEKNLPDPTPCSPSMHTEYRSVLGSLNWLQSRTQFQIAYKFSRAASAASKPTIGDVKALNKIVRTVRAQPLKLRFWPLKGRLRILGYPDASFQNNEDKSSQRGQCIFIAEERREHNQVSDQQYRSRDKKGQQDTNTRGSLVDYESSKIKRTALSTTVAELYSFMKCYGTSLFMKGLWMDISGNSAPVHMRTDAHNLVTTASTTHLPEQRETIHMIQMLRKESNSGGIADLAHVRTEDCLSDCLTKHSAKPDALIKAVETGILPCVDNHPSFRKMIEHKAYLQSWVLEYIFLTEPVLAILDETLVSRN